MTLSNRSGGSWLAASVVVACVAAGVGLGQTAEVYIGTSTTPMEALPASITTDRQPVLFVHGHNSDDQHDGVQQDGTDTYENRNFVKNFLRDGGSGLTSFQAALDLPANAWLGVEPYYIRFREQHRSIVEDAREIADAVERILHRHDSTYTPGMANPTTTVRVAIIAYSKGTISSRLYVKSLNQANVPGIGGAVPNLPAPRGFNPISELVAISPPNHGITFQTFDLSGENVATRQLDNGHAVSGFFHCAPFLDVTDEERDFIQNLNGHPMDDTRTEPFAHFDSEALGSRANGGHVSDGTLYACLYADGGRDFVGGSHARPAGDQGRVCGREVAANLATNAVNQEVTTITGSSDVDVHVRSVHTPEVICRTLTTVAHHRAPTGAFTCALDGVVPKIPPRTAVELVLDLSGSMLGGASPGGESKLSVLKASVEIFSQLYGCFAGPADRLGVVYFGTSTSSFTSGGSTLLPVTDANLAAILSDLGGRNTVPGQRTAMGAGLVAAIASLVGAEGAGASTRHIVLVTDGMQNEPPLVGDPPAPRAIGTTPATLLDTALGIRIHTIGIGNATSFVTLLSDIASGTGGVSQTTIDAAEDLQPAFTDALVEALKSNSPQLIDSRSRTLSDSSADERFAVGTSARRIVLQLSWRGGSKLRFTVDKDGADVTGSGRIVDGAFYRLFVIDPARSGLAAAGTWTMRISGNAPTRYRAAALVDEPRFRMEASVPRAVRAGKPIPIRVELRLDGKMLAGSATVRASVRKPKQSVGNLLGRGAARERTGPPVEGAGPADDRLALLLSAEADWKSLLPVATRIDLAPTRDGAYEGTFAATEVPGHYRIELDVAIDSKETGPIERRLSRSVLVRLGADASKMTVEKLGPSSFALHLRPEDALGNQLGPGCASLITVTANGKRLVPEDRLDGSYVVPLQTDPSRGISIDIDGATIIDGPLPDAGSSGAGTRSLTVALIALGALGLLVVAWRLAGRARGSR